MNQRIISGAKRRDNMEIKTIAVVGAGEMGSGLAQIASQSGLRVSLADKDPLAISKGFSRIDKHLKKLEEKGKISPSEMETIRSNIRASESLEDATRDADLILEAVTEEMVIKKSVFMELDEICGDHVIFASNTAGLSITELASATSRPDRFIGMHFFQPVQVMKLVEVIRGHLTSDETRESVKALAAKMSKTALEVKDAPGFLVSRLLIPMINEAIFILQEGQATAEEIDSSMKLGANLPMGPLALADLVGLDRVLNIQQGLYEEFRDSKYRPAPLLVKMVRAGQLGHKTGQGFFSYG
jgi:3-hydroxybutyryl-CoA dehydrogenase